MDETGNNYELKYFKELIIICYSVLTINNIDLRCAYHKDGWGMRGGGGGW